MSLIVLQSKNGHDFFGIGLMLAALKHDGTLACFRGGFTMSVKTTFSSSAQSFSTLPGMSSGPAAVQVLMGESVLFTLVADKHRGWSCAGGWATCGRVLFCASNPAKKLFRFKWLSRVVSLSQLLGTDMQSGRA